MAHVETYAIVVQEKRAGDEVRQLIVNNRYVDQFEKRDGDWRIAYRVVVTDSARTDVVARGRSPRRSP